MWLKLIVILHKNALIHAYKKANSNGTASYSKVDIFHTYELIIVGYW